MYLNIDDETQEHNANRMVKVETTAISVLVVVGKKINKKTKKIFHYHTFQIMVHQWQRKLKR